MNDFKPQDEDFNLDEFIGDIDRKYVKRFYCPSCRQKVVFSIIENTVDETFDCPMCQSIMLLEEDDG